MDVDMSVHARVCIWVKSFFDCSPCLFFETGSLNRPETIQPCWQAMNFKDFPVPPAPPALTVGVMGMYHHTQIFFCQF